MSRVTIKTIANDLGISHMTVSRALSDHPNVQKETRDKIVKRADELGYVKNAAAMVMRGDAPKIVGLLLPNIVNEFYARFANDLAVECDAQSLQLIIHLTNDDTTVEQKALEQLRQVQASSVVLVPAPRRSTGDRTPYGRMRVIELIRQSGTPDQHPTILVDDGPAIRAAVKHLVDKGHDKIAYIGANRDMSSGRARLDAFRLGAKQAGVEILPDLISTGVPSFSMGRSHGHAILAGGTATALLCGGVEISNGALSALMDSKTKLDEGFEFIGYGDPSFYSWVNNGVSTIRVPITELATRAAEMFLAADLSGPAPKDTFLAELIIR
ncbi:LacI family transcriptional regulator [Litoreibacter meonggei]|uniref:LacI family transcriptional regulator n=1 Tax=Litoreibacter meonggei TaxID=1049199 RepID=A0A497VLA2_9RHOB|nr:LacI family DNA-binding transcriptional regulator [Litoreibacter meonggei]RLJ40995.1 LacI family transcriptional regulator [Litoreibacter meonggei]